MARGSLARRLLVAGAFVWVASRVVAAGEAKPAPIEVPDDVPEAAVAPASPRRAFRKRFATSLAFSMLFFAGAAFTAGAGNELAPDVTSTDATPTVVAEATVPPPAPEVVTTDQVPVETAPAPAVTVEATVPPPAPEVVTTDESPAEAAPTPADPEPVRAVDAGDAIALQPTPARFADTRRREPGAGCACCLDTRSCRGRPAASPLSSRRPPGFSRLRSPRSRSRRSRSIRKRGCTTTRRRRRAHPPSRSRSTTSACPIVWGGAVPATGFDCSGLTRFVYAQLGVNLPHYAASQFAAFPKLDPAELQPGDLVFFEPKFDGPGHVAIYIGNDQMIEAPHTGALVRISSFSDAAAADGLPRRGAPVHRRRRRADAAADAGVPARRVAPSYLS